MKIIAHKSILHNNATNCTFLADELDEKVQTGTRENDSHIEWMGDLTIPIKQMSLLEFQIKRTEIISRMLDNPREDGIYPTGKCFEELDSLFLSITK